MKRAGRTPRLPLWTMLWLLAGCGGISTQLDSNSEGNEVRDRANGLYFDETRTDSIDGGEGDNTDWSYLDIADPGGVRISVGFDNPEKLEGAYVALFDEFGKRLDRRLVVPNTTSYVFDRDVKKVPNKLFVKVFTKDGKSVYSLGARISLEPKAAPQPVARVAEPEPEPEPEAQPVKRRTPRVRCASGMRARRGRCVCKRGYEPAGKGCRKKKAAPPSVAPTFVATPTTDAPVAVKSAGRTYSGRVTRVLPGANGESVTIVISFSAPGVKKGDRGQLFKNGAPLAGASVKITKASGKAAKAYVPVASSEVSNGKLTVKITAR